MNVPAVFQQLMGKLFGGKDWDFVLVYLDDILVASQSMEEYLLHLEKVATRIQEIQAREVPVCYGKDWLLGSYLDTLWSPAKCERSLIAMAHKSSPTSELDFVRRNC